MDDYRSKPAPPAEMKSALDQWLPVTRSEGGASASSSSATAPEQAATAVPVDVRELKALVGDDAELIREFLQDFKASAAMIAQELCAACAAGQTEAAVAAAHKQPIWMD